MPTRVKHRMTVKTSPALKRLNAAHAELKGGLYLKVGFIGDAEGGQVHEGEDGDGSITNARLAAVHEFGYPEGNIPERPFMAPSWNANLGRYEATAEKLLRGVASGALDLERGLAVLGLAMVQDIRSYVTQGPPIPPENAPEVKARKEAKASGAAGPVRTLVDTGRLMQSISYAVTHTKD